MFAFLFTPLHVHAGVEVDIADEETPVFAFFRMAQRYPDFDYWAENSPKMIYATDEFERADIKLREKTRLKWGFGVYNEHKDMLKVRAPIVIRVGDGNAGAQTLHFEIKNMADQSTPFFPFSYGKEAIALLPMGLSRFNGFVMNEHGRTRVEKHMGDDPQMDAYLLLRIRPLKADMTKPVVVGNTNFWMLTGDIAYLAFEVDASKDDEAKDKEESVRLLEYTAPWYMSESEKDLIDLLQR